MVTGFRASAPKFDLSNGGVMIQGGIYVGVGVVSEVYGQGRDRAVLPWPVIEVDCDALGGMSGGPCFDEGGYLVGLLCSSFEGTAGPSYMSLLWPALVYSFNPIWMKTLFGETTTLMDLPEQLIVIEGRHRVVRTTVPGGYTVAYRPKG